MDENICNRCGKTKPTSEFCKSSPYCRDCRNQAHKKWRMTRDENKVSDFYVLVEYPESYRKPISILKGLAYAKKVMKGYKAEHPFTQYKLYKMEEV